MSIACTKPKILGYAQELWTYRKLRGTCEAAGFLGLKQISHNAVHTILEHSSIKPNKITYYLKKDPEFETKMHDILVVYKQLSMCSDGDDNLIIPVDHPKTVTVS